MKQHWTKYFNFENIAFFVLCAVAVFATSNSMTDTNLIPKQLYSWLAISVVTLLFSVKILLGKRLNIDFYAWSLIITLVCCLEAIYAIFQWGVNHYFHLDNIFVLGHFDNPAGLMISLCVSLPFTLYVYSKSSRYKFLIFGAITIIFLGIIVSQSRTGIIVALIVLASYFMRQYKFSFKRICIVISVLMVALIFASYFVNQGSANGRLLIWQCCWEMIKDEPITGYGLRAFRRLYMNYQAAYLQANPDSSFAMLAANVNYPFNEYINLYLCFGILGYICLGLIVALLILSYRKYPTSVARYALLSLCIIAFISIFSYPFAYPMTWIISFLCIAVCTNLLHFQCRFAKFSAPIVLIVSICICINISDQINKEYKWNLAHINNSLVDYEKLFSEYHTNAYFLYDYSVLLYQRAQFSRSKEIADVCSSVIADYDVELLRATLCMKTNDLYTALSYFEKCSFMCPCRVRPLYGMFIVYNKMKDKDKAKEVAKRINSMSIKVSSVEINIIKNRINNYLKN